MRDRPALVVVGAGPTGLAAAMFAKRRGIDAIVIEQDDGILPSIRRYQHGMTFLSPPWHFEVCGIPLDTSAKTCTREDVLFYYARLLSHAKVDVRFNMKCIELESGTHGVRLVLDQRGNTTELVAARVLFTGWYTRRKSIVPPRAARLSVISALSDPYQAVGKRVAIVGGGLSAYEHAATLMLMGQSIVLVARQPLQKFYQHELFEALVRSSHSRLLTDAADIGIDGNALTFRSQGTPMSVECDLVIDATGSELDANMLDILRRAGVLDSGQVNALMRVPTFEMILKRQPTLSIEQIVTMGNAERPDLSRNLMGKRGVYLAGGILHGGASNAGVLVSIETARLAVDAMVGIEQDWDRIVDRLPAALHEWVAIAQPSVDAFEAFSPMRLMPRFHPTPTWVPAHWGSARVELLADGIHSFDTVGELAERQGCVSAADKQALMSELRELCWGKGLSWIPPEADTRAAQSEVGSSE